MTHRTMPMILASVLALTLVALAGCSDDGAEGTNAQCQTDEDCVGELECNAQQKCALPADAGDSDAGPADTGKTDAQDTSSADTGQDTANLQDSGADADPTADGGDGDTGQASDTGQDDAGLSDAGDIGTDALLDAGQDGGDVQSDTGPVTKCIQLSEETQINFGLSVINEVATDTITIENCSTSQTLNVSNIEITGDTDSVFGLQNVSGATGQLSPGGQVNFQVTFEPTDKTSYGAQLEVDSDDPARSSVQVPIAGQGTDNPCPTAVATGWLVGATTPNPRTSIDTDPLQTVQLDGNDSTDDGSVASYEWTLLARPQGSTSQLTPGTDDPDPTFFVDMVGQYVFELAVYDDDNQKSCDTATVTVDATPSQQIYFEVVWDTPSGGTPPGTDLNAHYLDTAGDWNTAPEDVFWQNPNPDWGVSSDATDDPDLLISDADGSGPEAIAHSNLDSSKIYKAGVYYNDDGGGHVSYGTARIYHNGQMSAEIEGTYLPSAGVFWEVATIESAGATITETDTVHNNGFP